MVIKQKYLFEPFLEIQIGNVVLMRPSDCIDYMKKCTPEHVEIINSTNLYFICKKHRLRFIENSLSYRNSSLHLGFELSTKKGVTSEFFTLHNYSNQFPDASQISIHEEMKYKLLVNWSIGTHSIIPIEMVVSSFNLTNNFKSFFGNEIFNYEVLYIGQSIGREGQSNACKRIIKHEKLQQILSDILENEPYNEVFIILCSIEKPYFWTLTDGRFNDDQSKNNFDSLSELVVNDKFSKKEILSLTEACWIKYFNPPYNILLKEKFPNGAEKLLQKCKKYDFNSICVAIDTSSIAVKLCSHQTLPNVKHQTEIQLHKDEDRINFQNILTTQTL